MRRPIESGGLFDGSAISSSIGTFSSTMRFTKLVLAPFFEQAAHPVGASSVRGCDRRVDAHRAGNLAAAHDRS